MDDLLRENGAEDPRTGLAGKRVWHLVEDKSLDGAGIKQVRERFESLVEGGVFRQGWSWICVCWLMELVFEVC
jgi:hypothetical protein